MPDQLLDSIQAKYGAIAESSLSTDHAGVKAVAEAFGYTADELTSIPAAANMVKSSSTSAPAAASTSSSLLNKSALRAAPSALT
jgi:stage III sporulation protein SpoIIIAA